MRIQFAIVLCTLIASFHTLVAASDVSISEFMASNISGVRDEDNTLPDWIELRNHTTTNINLGGWYLTDSAGNPTKWRIPATNLNAGAYMIIFADGKNRAVPGAPLHTSFNLTSGGEYLALMRPDLSIASAFSPQFPAQAPDVSHGFGAITTNSTLISTSALVRVRIPTGTEGANWAGTNFDDSAWTLGTNGVGYGTSNTVQADYSSAVLATAPAGYWRMNETSGTTATSLGSSVGYNATYNNATLGTAGPRPPAQPGFEADNNAPTFNGTSSHVSGPLSALSGRAAFSVGGWIYPTATPAARTGLFGQNDCVEFGFISGTTLECWTPGGGSVSGVPYPYGLNSWHHIVGVGDGTSIKIYIDGQLAGSGGAATASYGTSSYNFNIGGGGIQDAANNWFPGLIDEVVLYHRALSPTEILSLYQTGTNAVGGSAAQFVKTDVSTAMSNVNASAYVRIPFVVENPTNVSQLALRMRHDDGYAAFLNGVEVSRFNAADPLTNNSAATNTHSPLTFTDVLIGSSTLVSGTNILAIHGLNVAANDADFLIEAQLTATFVAADSSVPVYFTAPTPGAANNAGVANPGPAILDAAHTPNVPSGLEDIAVTARMVPTFASVSNMVLRYRVMYGPEIQLAMFDDGLHGDGGVNDGVYGANIPASAATNAQMVRWYFLATDTLSNTSRWPIYINTAESPQYFGTMVDAANTVTSKLSIVHLFVDPAQQSAVDSQAGGRGAVFYLDEFYDNIGINVRGNTTAGYLKKSHHLNFNNEHKFKHTGPGPRITRTSFVAEYPDPTYMRQGLSMWLAELMGTPGPFYIPVRLQLNGAFYQLANHSDTISDELIERLGYDPAGALYKAAGTVQTSQYSTGVFEKKTRLWENNADYLAMTAGIAETNNLATRKTNVFDMLDVPEILNYLVTARWAHENDDVWANMTFYRDTLGDSLWRAIPFDMNLSWGAIFYEGSLPLVVEGVQATNDIHKGHPLYGSSSCLPNGGGNYNRMYDVFFQVPELRQMFLRRLRTLLDTAIGPIGTPTNTSPAELRILSLFEQMKDEAGLDRARWGWPNKGGQCNFDPGINITNGVNAMLDQFVRLRRTHLYGKHSVTNTALAFGIANANNAGIPLAQASNLVLRIQQFEPNPSSGNQGHEFIQITNPNPTAVDLSGWKLDGGVEFTFRPGTVLPSNGVIYLTPNLLAYRTRSTAPKPGLGLFVVGNYKGMLDARGETVTLSDRAGRPVHTNTYAPSASAVQQYLRITEVMYHPGPTNAGTPYLQDDYEFIELKNISTNVTLNLLGVHFTNGIEFAFTATNGINSLAPGRTVVLVKNSAAYVTRHGPGTNIAGTYTGTLDNSGERVQLHDAIGEEIMDFTYNNSWHPVTDGLGFSLVIVNENAHHTAWNSKPGWRASGALLGSPGASDPAPATFAPVLVNEVLANTELPDTDAIELWNSGTNVASIGNWFLSDDFFTPKKFRIAAGTTINAGDHLTFTEAQFNTVPSASTNFALGAMGDEAYLFAADAAGNLLGYYHGFHFDASSAGVSFGRHINSQAGQHIVAQAALTLGAANSGPLVGPVVITEIMYHPPGVGGADDSANEYIELLNISTNTVALYDEAAPTNSWRLKDAVDFSFSTNTSLPPGGYLLVVGFNPQSNTNALATFRARWGVDTNVPIVGPYSGQLDNSTDNIELVKPQPVATNGFDYVMVDKVDYQDVAPWNAAADGLGLALQRIVVGDYGNEPTNWTAAALTPGTALTPGGPPVITQQPANVTLVGGFGANLAVAATGSNLLYQWRFNGALLAGATNATLTFTNMQPAQSGGYSVFVWNTAGATLSATAAVAVLQPVYIATQPLSQTGPSGTNVTFGVVAVGTGTLRYQWSFNGTSLNNATNSTFSLLNAQLPQHGLYAVHIDDDISSVDSLPAQLYLLVRPGVVVFPAPTTVVQGRSVTLTCVATGAAPIHYRWLRNNTTYVAQTTSTTLTVTNMQTNTFFRLAITNLAGSTSTTNITVTVLRDSDGDGVPDNWEIAHGMITNSAADGLLDNDNDGMINRDEYFAGTRPNDSNSVLRVSMLFTNGAPLQFTAQSNILYTIQYRTNLDGSVWQTLSNVAPAPGVRPILFDSPPGTTNGPRYLRVLVPPLP